MTLDERKERARRLHESGYNCAQSVLMVFDDYTGLDAATAAKVSNGFGAGVGATGEICGVVTGMAMAEGMRHSPAAGGKVEAGKCVNALAKEFCSRCGYLRCADLKGKGHIPCADLISEGVEIYHDYLINNDKKC